MSQKFKRLALILTTFEAVEINYMKVPSLKLHDACWATGHHDI